MEYKRAQDSGIITIWKNDEMIGQFFPVDELWRRKVYLYKVGGKAVKDEKKRIKRAG